MNRDRAQIIRVHGTKPKETYTKKDSVEEESSDRIRWNNLGFPGTIVIVLVISIFVYTDSITKPHNFHGRIIISSTEVNSNFDTLYNKVNELDSSLADSTVFVIHRISNYFNYGGTS